MIETGFWVILCVIIVHLSLFFQQDAFSDYFPEQGATEDKLWKGLMFTAVGLVTLGTMVARSWTFDTKCSGKLWHLVNRLSPPILPKDENTVPSLGDEQSYIEKFFQVHWRTLDIYDFCLMVVPVHDFNPFFEILYSTTICLIV